MSVAVIDYETRSTVDLKKRGGFVYAEHPTTEPICLAALVDDKPPIVYIPEYFKNLIITDNIKYEIVSEKRIIETVLSCETVVAQNSMFEYLIWNRCCKWPTLPMEQLHDTMAQLAYHALPMNLEMGAKALGLSIQKNMAGNKAMKKICSPKKPTKKEQKECPEWERLLWWNEDPELLEATINYCCDDVLAEKLVYYSLAKLPAKEREIWLLNEKINLRGIGIDVENVNAIVSAVRTQETEQLKIFQELTEGKVSGPRSYVALKNWVNKETGLKLKSVGKDVVAHLEGLPEKVEKVLAIKSELSKSSVAKFDSMLTRMTDDHRVKGWSAYHAASTGRWAAWGLQLHNNPRDCYKPSDYEKVVSIFASGNPGLMETLWDSPYYVASRCVRGALAAQKGKRFICSDFSAVEGRGLVYLAGEQWVVNAYAQGQDMYKHAVAGLLGIGYDEVTKTQRSIGKVQELFLGYAGGIGAFATGAKTYRIDLEAMPEIVLHNATDEELYRPFGAVDLAKRYVVLNPKVMSLSAATACDVVKQRWRNARPMITLLWKQVEACARDAINEPGKMFSYRRIDFLVNNGFLKCRIPSGRVLHYRSPKLGNIDTSNGEFHEAGCNCPDCDGKRPDVTFMGMKIVGGKTTRQWSRLKTFGGKMVENCIAGNAEILTPEGWVRLDRYTEGTPVWDGEDFVIGGKLLDRGVQTTVCFAGIDITEDHLVLCNGLSWRTVSEISLQSGRFNRAKVQLPNDHRVQSQRKKQQLLESKVRLWENNNRTREGDDKETPFPFAQVMRVHDEEVNRKREQHPRYVRASGVLGVAVHAGQVPSSHASSVSQLRRAGYLRLRRLGKKFLRFLERHGRYLSKRFNVRQEKQFRKLQQRELPMGELSISGEQQKRERTDKHTLGATYRESSIKAFRDKHNHFGLPDCSQVAGGQDVHHTIVRQQTVVFDIQNCGPRSRFVVRAGGGYEPIIVHNCTQAFCRDLLAEAMLRLEAANYPLVLHVHDEAVAEVPEGWGSLDEFNQIMEVVPPWAKGMPIKAEGWVGYRYQKEGDQKEGDQKEGGWV